MGHGLLFISGTPTCLNEGCVRVPFQNKWAINDRVNGSGDNQSAHPTRAEQRLCYLTLISKIYRH